MKKIFTLLFLLAIVYCFGQTITSEKPSYNIGEPMTFNYTSGTFDKTDWIGVYKKGEVPDGDPVASTWAYIPTASGKLILNGQNQGAALTAGDYSVHLFCCDGYKILATVDIKLTGVAPAAISLGAFALAGKKAKFTYSGGTGSPTDWIGIYKKGVLPGTEGSLHFVYVPSKAGTMDVDISSLKLDSLKNDTFDVHLLCCDGYDKLASTTMIVYDTTKPDLAPSGALKQNVPITWNFAGGTGALTDWIGIYPAGTKTDGSIGSTYFEYVNAPNGKYTMDTIPALKPGTMYDAHLFCCDDYIVIASYKNWTVSATTPTIEIKDKNLFSLISIPSGLHIKFEEVSSGRINLFSTMGQLLQSHDVTNETDFQIYNLNSAVYIVQYTDGNKLSTIKTFVK